MKKLLLALCLLSLRVSAQTPAIEASQSQVNARIVGTPYYVSPRRLMGGSTNVFPATAANITNVIANASAGDWVIVYGGAPVTNNNLLKKGVNYEIYPDIIYSETDTNSPGYGIFTDRGCGATTNIIICHGNVYYCSGTNGTLNFGNYTGNVNATANIELTNSLSEMHFIGNNIYTTHIIATALPAISFRACSTNTTVECNNIFSWMPSVTLNDATFGPTAMPSADVGIGYSTNGYTIVVHGYVSPAGSYGLVSTAQDPNLVVDMFVSVGKMTRKFYGLWNSPNYRTWLTADVIDTVAAGSGAITLEGSQKTYIKAKKIAGGSSSEPVVYVSPIGGTSNTEVWVNTDKIEANGAGTVHYAEISCGMVQINSGDWTNTTGTVTNGIVVSGGTDVKIGPGTMWMTMTGSKGVVHSGGNLTLSKDFWVQYNGAASVNAYQVFSTASGLYDNNDAMWHYTYDVLRWPIDGGQHLINTNNNLALLGFLYPNPTTVSNRLHATYWVTNTAGTKITVYPAGSFAQGIAGNFITNSLTQTTTNLSKADVDLTPGWTTNIFHWNRN